MRVQLQPAFVLHQRPYRETSLLLDVFTKDYGRISLIARGVRKPKSTQRALLRPFTPLLLSWQGKTDLMNLCGVEAEQGAWLLKGDCLFSAFYLNELLIKLLQKQDPYPKLYTIYYDTLLKLTAPTLKEAVLRIFEKKLLEELGYGLQLSHDIEKGSAILPEKLYRFYPEYGFKQIEPIHNEPLSLFFSGQSLLNFANEKFLDIETLKDAKRLMRMALSVLLGKELLHSRKLF